jgi:hypothetical protein
MARAIPDSVCRSSGSSVRLPAKLTAASVMVCPFLLPGRAVCPALRPGGRWTPWHAARPPGASDRANEVSYRSRPPTWVSSGAGLVGGRLRLGVGHAGTVRPAPSTLGVVEERGSHHEDCSQCVFGISNGGGTTVLPPFPRSPPTVDGEVWVPLPCRLRAGTGLLGTGPSLPSAGHRATRRGDAAPVVSSGELGSRSACRGGRVYASSCCVARCRR